VGGLAVEVEFRADRGVGREAVGGREIVTDVQQDGNVGIFEEAGPH